jgi:GNAT superfamily N-acetyltransferase
MELNTSYRWFRRIALFYQLRKATLADQARLEALIALSARTLSARDYTPEQIEAALRGTFGVDTQLIVDGTYFVAESGGEILGCGGWSRRRTLFGGDARTGRDCTELDPRSEPAKIRAFFVDPAYARRGIGRALLERCEADARAHGFSRVELMATLPGVRLYGSLGYTARSPVHHELAPGLTIEFVPMHKSISDEPSMQGGI